MKKNLKINKINVKKINNVPYIIVKEGDCVETISKEFGMSKSNLRNYNDLGRKGVPADNGKFFLKQKKGNKMAKKITFLFRRPCGNRLIAREAIPSAAAVKR